MVYEWDEDRAHRARVIKMASTAAWIMSVIALPATLVMALSP